MKTFPKDYKLISIIGLLFILIGLTFNEWSIGRLLTPDGAINNLPKRIIILLLDLISIFIGFLILKYRANVRARSREIIFTALAFIFFLIILEGGMRGFYYVKNRTDKSSMSFEDHLGWKVEENTSWKKNKPGYGEISYSTSKYGFRVFGDINTNKIKIFVIGDSYTRGTTVSDGDTYYEYLIKQSKEIEIFAYGAGGYGSLQEYMILDKYFDEIKPDLILWQFCNNDLVNNSYELESRSHYANNHNTRPYFDHRTGQITRLYPRQTSGLIYRLAQYSYLLKFLYIKLDIVEADTVGSIEDHLTENHPWAIETVRTTSAIMGLVEEKVDGIPIVAFPVDSDRDNADYLPWSNRAYSNISEKHSIYFIDYLPEVLDEAQAKGIVIDAPLNAHWNNTGHKIVGETILNYLREHNLLKKNYLVINYFSKTHTTKEGLQQAAVRP